MTTARSSRGVKEDRGIEGVCAKVPVELNDADDPASQRLYVGLKFIKRRYRKNSAYLPLTEGNRVCRPEDLIFKEEPLGAALAIHQIVPVEVTMVDKVAAPGREVKIHKPGRLCIDDTLQVRVDDARPGRREVVPVYARVTRRPDHGLCRAGYSVGKVPCAKAARLMFGGDYGDDMMLGERIEVRERHALSAVETAPVPKRRGGGVYGVGAERTTFARIGQSRSGIDLPLYPDGTDPAPDTGEGLPAVLKNTSFRPDLMSGEHDPLYSS